MNMPVDAPARREPWTVHVAMWSARHRWPVFALWFVMTIGLFVGSLAAGGINAVDANGDPTGPKLEAEEAYDVFGAGSAPEAPSERLLVVIDGGTGAAADTTFQAGVASLVADLTAAHASVDGVDSRTFDSVVDPFSAPPEAGLVSADGTTVQIVGTIPGERARVEQLLAPIPSIVESARVAMPASAIHAVSNTLINNDINELISGDLDNALRITLPLTFAILLLAFGAIVASLIPLVLAVTSLLAAFGLIGLYSRSFQRSARTPRS